MIGNGQFDEPARSWSRRQASSLRRAWASRLRAGSGSCQPWRYSTHPPSSPGSQVPYVGQVRKEAKGSGKGGSQSRLLVLLIRESRLGPSMSPLIMSHINRTRPRQGLQLVNRPRETLGDSHLISSDPRSRFGLVCDLLCCRGNTTFSAARPLRPKSRIDSACRLSGFHRLRFARCRAGLSESRNCGPRAGSATFDCSASATGRSMTGCGRFSLSGMSQKGWFLGEDVEADGLQIVEHGRGRVRGRLG